MCPHSVPLGPRRRPAAAGSGKGPRRVGHLAPPGNMRYRPRASGSCLRGLETQTSPGRLPERCSSSTEPVAGRGMLCSQTPVLRFSRCESYQFPCVVGIGGLLHILMKTPDIFALKGEPKFDWFCHRHFTSGYDILSVTPQICFSWSIFTIRPPRCPDPFVNQPVQGLRTSEYPKIGFTGTFTPPAIGTAPSPAASGSPRSPAPGPA